MSFSCPCPSEDMHVSIQQSHPPICSPPTAADFFFFFTQIMGVFPPLFSSCLYISYVLAEFQSFPDNSRCAIYFNINVGELLLAKSLPNRREII